MATKSETKSDASFWRNYQKKEAQYARNEYKKLREFLTKTEQAVFDKIRDDIENNSGTGYTPGNYCRCQNAYNSLNDDVKNITSSRPWYHEIITSLSMQRSIHLGNAEPHEIAKMILDRWYKFAEALRKSKSKTIKSPEFNEFAGLMEFLNCQQKEGIQWKLDRKSLHFKRET